VWPHPGPARRDHGRHPGRVSQIECGELSAIEAIARYVQALGGRLDLVASFTDHTLTVTTTGAYGRSCLLALPPDQAVNISGLISSGVMSLPD
jgi:hypothetical protein